MVIIPRRRTSTCSFSQQRRSANRVEPRGPQDGEAGREALGESNVIRLPRDWLGPREELVPFGISPAPEDVADLDSTVTLPASDFWGEESAAVQHALPAPAGRAETEAGPHARRPRVPLRAALLAAGAAASLAAGTVGLGLMGPSRPATSGGSAFQFGSLAVVLPPMLAVEAAKASSDRRVARVRVESVVRHPRRRPTRDHSLPTAAYLPVSTSSLGTQGSSTAPRDDTPATPSATGVRTGVADGSSVRRGCRGRRKLRRHRQPHQHSGRACRTWRTIRTRALRMTARSADLRPSGSSEEVG